MRNFEFVRPDTEKEAAGQIDKDAVYMAGGSDLLGELKSDILPEYPKKIVSLKKIPGLTGIKYENGTLKIGAMTTLADVAKSDVVKEHAPALSEAAHSVATPLVRNMGTIGGNICQDVRCWFYRYPNEIGGRLNCARKGGEMCYGILGDNRYHSIFGGMKTGLTPCSIECPAGTDIPGYMAQIRQGNWDKAAEIIMRANPLPMLTSRVCPHNCQSKCNQCKNGDPVSIHSVERALGDYILEHADRFYRQPEKETGKKVSIVGAGPAGLTAAYFMRKMGHTVTVYERMEEAGGVLMYGIPEYRLPKHYVRSVQKALTSMGIRFRFKVNVGKDITVEEIEKESDTMFLDTGAWKQPILGIDGENLTQFGLNFLVEVKRFMTKQIGKNVLVCGGGNVAMDVSLTAKRLGADKVTLVCLEQRHEMPATEEEIHRAEEEGVKIINGRGLNRVIYDGKKVEGLETKRCVSVRDANGRFNPKYDDKDLTVIPADTIILATGQRVDLSFLGDRFREEIQSARGLIEVGEHNNTRKPGVYAGGDAATGPSIAIKAIRAGANAAKSMSDYLGFPMPPVPVSQDRLHNDHKLIHQTHAKVEPDTPIEKRCLDREDSKTLTREEARQEAGRCMNCGCYSVNASDITPVLVMADASIRTSKKTIAAKDLFTTKLRVKDMLDPDEIVEEIDIPAMDGARTHYNKFRLRDSVDFAVVSLASRLCMKDGRISEARLVLGGAAPVPMELTEAEEYLKGRTPDKKTAEEAAQIALAKAEPFEKNAYKVQIAESLVKSAVEEQQQE
ncbi:MAG: FAD-dependent oxidoreductase [Lachnospiraceae bacterium]|jgi:NADPH-dependent glutamate synthase beta subunit-like oxidoreductase/CO/xanthine dehydrogenase FAD-binding subunit